MIDIEAPAWLAEMTPAEVDEYERMGADLADAERMRAATRDERALAWPALARTIRELGGIDGLGQIARADVPGGLWRQRGKGVAYDELPLALASAGLERRYAEMDGDALIAELWTAWDGWQAHQAAAAVRIEVDESAAPAAEVVRPALVGPLAAARRDVAGAGELPEPDAADIEAYQVAELFGGIGEESAPRLVGGDPDIIRRGLDAITPRPKVTIKKVPERKIPDEVLRELDEAEALERAAAQDRAERRGRLRVVRPAGVHHTRPAAVAQEDRARPAYQPVGRGARVAMVAIIAALFAASVAGLVALVAAVAGADIPALAWTLAMSLPAAGAGILPAALAARQAQSVNRPAAGPARRRAA